LGIAAMKSKRKRSQNSQKNSAPSHSRPPDPGRMAATDLRPQADARWQRTIRYVWDKGGSKGSR